MTTGNDGNVDTSDACDRRLSRAARQLVQDFIVPHLHHYSQLVEAEARDKQEQEQTQQPGWMEQEHNDLFSSASSISEPQPTKISLPASAHRPTSLAPYELWKTLERFIVTPDTCWLTPSKDILFEDERQSYTGMAVSKRFAQRPGYPVWYYSGYSGKAFATRFYLDLHMTHYASKNKPKDNNNTIDQENGGICWADTVCDALGGSYLYQETALDLEPFYGRGSGGFGPDQDAVRRGWEHAIPPCNNTLLRHETRPLCEQLMDGCFADPLAMTLQESVCRQQLQSCSKLLHRQHHYHLYASQQDWMLHSTSGSTALLVLLVVLLLLYWSIQWFCILPRGTHGGRHNRHRGRELLQKNKGPNRFRRGQGGEGWYSSILSSLPTAITGGKQRKAKRY